LSQAEAVCTLKAGGVSKRMSPAACLRWLWLAALHLVLILAQQPEQWPGCQEQSRVFRHNGAFGIFVDLTIVGAKEGCWQEDCTRTDKFVCPSPADCAAACAQVEVCKFWTYEPGIRKCFMRSSDAGREDNPDFVSGARSCLPGGLGSALGGKVGVPFARAAIWAAELPSIRPCDAGIGGAGCENPYAAMGVWRYAVNNLRAAVRGLPEGEKEQHKSTLQYVQQVAVDVANFYLQPTAESFQVVVTNANTVFSALQGWLKNAPPTEIDVGEFKGSAPHLPGGRSAKLPHALASARTQLADGREMPLVGFGTWYLVGQTAYDATIAALRAGYRHIDTAQAYQNEHEVGLGIRDSGVPRNEIFLATKISDPDEYPRLADRLEAQLAALGTDYLDLYMLHSPADQSGMEAAWRAMEQLHARGTVRSLGVSNFGVKELEALLAFARVKPVYVQNKFSVYNPGEQQVGTTSIQAFVREHGLQMVGYSVINPWPFLLPPMEDPHVREVSARYGRTPSQVLHRWALQLGNAVLPRSTKPSRIEENVGLFDFELSEVDMRLLSGLVALSESTLSTPLAPPWADDVYGLRTLAG